jgi:tetratricopeptide (TPR) repeat protein
MDVIRAPLAVLAGIVFASGMVAAPRALPAQAPAGTTVARDSSLLSTAAANARLAAGRLEGQARGRSGRADPGSVQYLAAVEYLTKSQFDSALTPLRAAVLVNQNSARYHGDLAYALAGVGQLEDAATEYATSVRLQAANPWYYVGLAVVRANQERWQQAAANFALALTTDSSILDPRLVVAASYCFERGGFDSELFDWSVVASQKFPNEPAPWLRLATIYRQKDDTAHGLAAIRQFRALAPDDRLGAAVYALYLYDQGQMDSAITLASRAAADSSLRNYAWPVYLRVGARLLQAKNLDRASQVLEQGRAIAPPGRHAQFSLYLGYANVQRLAPLYTVAAQNKNCQDAKMVDSLTTTVDHDLNESVALGDSAQINQIRTTVLPQIRSRLSPLLETCRNR